MDAVVANSAEMIRKGSKSFAAAAKLFSPDTRHSAFMLYAWCRHCDDEIDGQTLGFGQHRDDPAAQKARLDRLYERTRAALGGAPQDDPIFAAFQRVAQTHDMPARYPLELLDGFAMDVGERSYETLEDTLSYCYHVAGVVGVMMAIIMGVRDTATLNRASDLGLGFQLTNIARDVIEDAENGRVYLPSAWLQDAGLHPPTADTVAAEENRAAVFAVVDRLLDEADRYYASAAHGLPALDWRSAWAIATARGVYRNIGSVVRQRQDKAWNVRARVGRTRKIVWTAAGLVSALQSRRPKASAPSRSGLWTAPELTV